MTEIKESKKDEAVSSDTQPINLSADDWTEIYYSLINFLKAPVTQGDDEESTEWRRHLRRITNKIGPDGIRAYLQGVSGHIE